MNHLINFLLIIFYKYLAQKRLAHLFISETYKAQKWEPTVYSQLSYENGK